MKYMITLLSLAAAATVSAREVPHWKNLDVFSVNAETERTELIFHSSWEDALTKDFEQSENYVSLNGTWKFKYHESQEEMDPAIGSTTAAQAGDWADIKVVVMQHEGLIDSDTWLKCQRKIIKNK
jgi:beta-galactosidase